MLRAKLFGHFELRGPEGRISCPSEKLSALLALLAMATRPVSRDQITSLLWGSHFDDQARQNFRQALARLRKIIGPEALVSDDQTGQIHVPSLDSDVRRFEALVKRGGVENLREAAELLEGDLLEGIDLREPAWEDWLGGERRRISNLSCDALENLGRLEFELGRHNEALRRAEECISRDIFREDAHRLAIRSFVALGRRSEAVKHYQHLAERLKQELGTSPEEETTVAYQDAQQNHRHGDYASPTPVSVRRPSIAVLPFVNLSNDPEQDYFIDGMVDEIITALSRFHWLFVIARNSSFAYKGRAVDMKQIGRELGVRYVLEGSVRKAGTRLRITGQLADTGFGATLWADRFDGDLEDIFDLQDMVTSQVVGAIAPKLEHAEIERSKRKPTGSLDAFDHYLRGQMEVVKWTREGNRAASHHFTRAHELDPEFASAFAMSARCYSQSKAMGWSQDSKRDNEEVKHLTQRAIELGRDDPVVLSASGLAIGYVLGDLDTGVALLEESIKSCPNFAQSWFFCGWVQGWRGEADAAISRISRALLLSPRDPHISNMRRGIAFAYFIGERYAEAISAAEVAVPVPQNAVFGFATIAASAALLGRQAEAERAMSTLLQYDPNLSSVMLRERFPIRHDSDFERWAMGLGKAGLPA